jgi:oxygen-independent coproporphyrinogen-3 oxidase
MAKQETVNQYIAALHKEIERVVKYINPNRKISQIHYGGGTPTVLPVAVLKEFNDKLLSAFPHIEKPEIAIECHPAYLDETYWQSLVDAGFNRISIGIQDFDEKVLKAVNRRPSLLNLETVFRILKENSVGINLDLLYGLPLQTPDGFCRTVARAAELQPDRIVTFSYAHVPWVNPCQSILEKTGLPTAENKSRMYENARNTLLQSGYRAIGLDHFVKPDDELYIALENKQLHRNFQGYCTRRTTGQVYAFGVTAISQLSSAYAQNSKNIEEYILLTDKGLATAKGYALSADEQITREVIETLMCNYSINWNDLSASLNLPVEKIRCATAYDKSRFRQFAEDGIITLSDAGLEITDEGRLFVRNVAAAFDRLITTDSHKRFSRPV